MLYLGQTHTVSVPLDIPVAGLTGDGVRTAFEDAYRTTFGRLLYGIPMRVMNYRVAVIGRRPAFDMGAFAPVTDRTAEQCRTGSRRIYADGAWHDAVLYDRLALPVGARVEGPAILEQADTTIFIDPGLKGTVDSFGNVVIDRMAG